MGLLNLGWAVCFLPLAFIVLSYAVETRRAIAITCTLGTALAVVAAVLLLGAELGHGRPTYQSTLPIFTYPVIQTPFNAASRTLLAATFQPSIGILVDPLSTTLALAVALSALVLHGFLVVSSRAAGQTVMLHRAVALAAAAALGLVLAPGYVQAAGAIALLAVAAYLAAADDADTVGLRIAARRIFLAGWLAALGLLLTGVFLASKFSGAIEAVATHGPHPSATYPDGFDFVALASRWLAAPHGTVTGVGPRTLVLAAVLELVVALLLVAAVPLAAVSRRATGAAGVACAWITVVGMGLGGVALLARTAVLLEVATHVLPVLGLAGAAGAVLCAAAALQPAPLDRRVLWLAASGLATAVAGIGLGAVAGAVALAATLALAVPAALCALAILAAQRGGRAPALAELLRAGGGGAVGRAALLGLGASAGAVGLGTFFARAAILSAAWTGRLPAGTTIDPAARALVALGVVVAGALAAAALVRAADPAPEPGPTRRPARPARTVRARPERGARAFAAALLAVGVLAAISGLAVLPGVGPSLGGFVATPPGRPALGVNWVALLLTLVVPVVAAVLARRGLAARGAALAVAAPQPGEEPDGTGSRSRWSAGAAALEWLATAERLGLGLPARLVLAVDARLAADGLGAIGEGVRGLSGWLGRLTTARRDAAAAAMVATAVLTVAALALWVGLQHAGGAAP